MMLKRDEGFGRTAEGSATRMEKDGRRKSDQGEVGILSNCFS